MKKILLFTLLIVLQYSISYSQTETKGEANRESSALSISLGVKQWFMESPAKSPLNSFYVGVGRMPTIENPLYFEINLHFIPAFDFEYRNRYSSRSFKGNTKATQAVNANVGFLIVDKYSDTKFYPTVGLGATFNFKPGYNSISPAYQDTDYMIDNNGIAVGLHPYLGAFYKISPNMLISFKGGYVLQTNKNQYEKKHNLYESHFFTDLGIKLNFTK